MDATVTQIGEVVVAELRGRLHGVDDPEPVKRSETSGCSSWVYLPSDSILDGVGLIQTLAGSAGALGEPRWNRSGCAR